MHPAMLMLLCYGFYVVMQHNILFIDLYLQYIVVLSISTNVVLAVSNSMLIDVKG